MTQIWMLLFFIGFCQGVSYASECTSTGRFPNRSTPDCRGYTYCIMTANKNFTTYKIPCPQHFIFNHIDSQCTNSTNYQCLPTFNCTKEGNFLISEDSCASYVTCLKSMSNTEYFLDARLITCPTGEGFNSVEGKCVKETLFECNKVVTAINSNIDPPNIIEVVDRVFDINVSDTHVVDASANVAVSRANNVSVKNKLFSSFTFIVLSLYCTFSIII